jgi:CheY-like chemotaxis protein
MKALIAEDETILAENIEYCLKQKEFEGEQFDVVDIASNGAVALNLITKVYDLVILDLKMPQVDGIQIIEALKRLPSQKRPWIILITAYPGAYETARLAIKMEVNTLLKKPFELQELIGIIRELVRERHRLLTFEESGERPQCHWIFALSELGTAFIQVKGLLNFADFCPLPWSRHDSLVAGRQEQVVGELVNEKGPLHRHWRFYAQSVGSSLFNKLFVGNVQDSLVAAGACVPYSHNLRMTFVGSRSYLKLPFEFLNDGGDYLILKHPMKRFVSGLRPESRMCGRANLLDILSELREIGEKLKILLVASNTFPPINGVDEEVSMLYDYLSQMLPQDRFEVDYIPTEKATHDEIVFRLTNCHYHFLHYAGHGYHDERFPDKSKLFFWEKENRQGEVKDLTAIAFKYALRMRGHELRFVYFSCCSSAATSDESALLDSDFLGMVDSLILAGVPSAVGFRWPVSDWGARELAQAFYRSLFDQGELDTALFQARCKLSGEGQDNSDWLSPVLIVQE